MKQAQRSRKLAALRSDLLVTTEALDRRIEAVRTGEHADAQLEGVGWYISRIQHIEDQIAALR